QEAPFLDREEDGRTGQGAVGHPGADVRLPARVEGAVAVRLRDARPLREGSAGANAVAEAGGAAAQAGILAGAGVGPGAEDVAGGEVQEDGGVRPQRGGREGE